MGNRGSAVPIGIRAPARGAEDIPALAAANSRDAISIDLRVTRRRAVGRQKLRLRLRECRGRPIDGVRPQTGMTVHIHHCQMGLAHRLCGAGGGRAARGLCTDATPGLALTGFLGFWAPSMILTAELYPTRIRGVGNGFSWAVAWLVGFVSWPFVTIGIQQSTGSFAKAFLIVPVAMLLMGVGIWLFTPEHRGKELDAIAV